MTAQLLPTQNLYNQDYYLWLETTLKQLQDKDSVHLDWDHLIEEIEALGQEQKRKVKWEGKIVTDDADHCQQFMPVVRY